MNYKISKWKEVAWVNDGKKQLMDLEEGPQKRKTKKRRNNKYMTKRGKGALLYSHQIQ